MQPPDDSSAPLPRDRAKLDEHIAASAELTLHEVALLRRALLDARDALERRRSAHAEAALPSEGQLADEMDLASRDQDMGFALLLADKDLTLGAELDAALRRMDDGSYGLCEGTDEPIGFRRLEARPWTRFSVGYQEQLERERRGHVR